MKEDKAKKKTKTLRAWIAIGTESGDPIQSITVMETAGLIRKEMPGLLRQGIIAAVPCTITYSV